MRAARFSRGAFPRGIGRRSPRHDLMWCTTDTGWSKAGTSILFGPVELRQRGALL